MSNFGLIDWLVVIVYMIAMAALGIYQSRKVKSAGDFFAGGRSFNKWFMITHSLGTGTHADDPVGVAGAAYQRGISGIWYTYAYLFLTPFYWIIAPFFRRSRYLTTADFFDARFSKNLGLLYAIMGVLTFSVNTGTLLKGTGAIVTAMTGHTVPEWIPIWGMTVVFVAYGFTGGIVATIVTEFIQGFLIVIMSLLLIPFGLAKIGGFSALHAALSADKFSLAAPQEITLWWIVAATVANLIGIVAQPHIMEICATGKTEFEGRMGFTYGNFVKRFCAMGWALTGLIVLAMVGQGHIDGTLLAEKRELTFGIGIRELLPVGLTGVMFASILAAQMSTLSAFMVAGSALITRNVYQKFINPRAKEKDVLWLARFAGLVVVALGVVFCYKVKGVADALTVFWGLSTLTGVFIWAGILWRRTNATGAWLSFLTMATIWSVLGPFGQMFLHPMFPSVDWLGMFADKGSLPKLILCYLPAGVITLIIGSLIGKGVPKEILDKFYLLVNTPVGREKILVDAGIEMAYKGAVEGHPWELNHPKAVNWGGFAIGFLFAVFILFLLWVLTVIGAP